MAGTAGLGRPVEMSHRSLAPVSLKSTSSRRSPVFDDFRAWTEVVSGLIHSHAGVVQVQLDRTLVFPATCWMSVVNSEM